MTNKREQTPSMSHFTRLVEALQEIQNIPRLPDTHVSTATSGGYAVVDDSFGSGYNGALYTACKIARAALAAVGIPGDGGG